MAKDLYRRMVMFSPEILDDLQENKSVTEKTLGSLTHLVGAAQTSVNPFVARKNQILQEQAQQFGVVRSNMFGHGVAGEGINRHIGPFAQIVDKATRGAPKVREPKRSIFEEMK